MRTGNKTKSHRHTDLPEPNNLFTLDNTTMICVKQGGVL